LLPQTEHNVELISGVGDAADVHQRIIGLLSARFPETFGIEKG
jgi:hypothetical protein